MAQSERIFRDMLCESRSHPVESTDPNTARAIDELKRQLREAKAELEGERTKARLLASQCEKDIRKVREEADKKLSASLEALSVRKEQERVTDVRKVEDRVRREWETALRASEAKKNEEMIRVQRKWLHDRDEEVRRAVREERERCYHEVMAEHGEVSIKEDKLTRELFQLSQQNSALEDQVANLSRENRTQIEQLRRMKHEHELEIADILRQHQSEASRDFAQLRLAEQILAERETDLHLVETKAERERVEKEQMVEEMAAMKSALNSSIIEPQDSPQSSRRSIGGVLQRRLEDVEASNKRLEEDKAALKQENASLRKRLVQESSSEGKGGTKDDEKTKKLRKRNAELVTVVKTLDEKYKSLKSDYDQLKSAPGDSEAAVRKSLNRQHAKDIMEYTKQIHGKEREITELKRKLAKLEVSAKPPPESTSELEKKVKVMAMDRLKMEKLMTKLCLALPDETELTSFSHSELQCEAACVEALDLENQTLRQRLAALQQGEEGSKVNTESERLKTEIQRLTKFEEEALSLRESLENMETLNSDLNQQSYTLRQRLEVSEMAVSEGAEQVAALETELSQQTTTLKAREESLSQLAEECERARSEQAILHHEITALKSQLEDRDKSLKEQELLCQQLQARVNQSPMSSEVGVQTSGSPSTHQVNPITSRPLSDITTHIRGNPHEAIPISRDPLNSSLDCEMKAAGVEITDPYDSSEGAGFSDTNLSTLSLESIKNDRIIHDDQVGVASPIKDQVSRVETKKHESDDEVDAFHEASPEPVLYIAKFSYNPAHQSPNQSYEAELPLTAGDTVYVYGEMDVDGFYQGRLSSGATGLVPSNFVERVAAGEVPSTRRHGNRLGSNLDNIEEVDEDSSLSDSSELSAPTNVVVEHQFVDGDNCSVALRWSLPSLLPSNLLGYTVYLNGAATVAVQGPDQCSVLLANVPLTQLVKITVRSMSGQGESPDSAPPIILNPYYPEPPHNITTSLLHSPTSLLVKFSPHPHSITPVTHYTAYLNDFAVTQLEVTESAVSQSTLSMLVLPKDVINLETELSTASLLQLSVTASNESYMSLPSQSVGVIRAHVAQLLLAGDKPRSEYNPTLRQQDLELRQYAQIESHHVISGNNHVTNGMTETNGESKVRYYRALYSYDPEHQSPNVELAEEELAFSEGDIIIRAPGEDVDGFFEGQSHGRTGLVPSNMVQELTDPDAISQLEHTNDTVVNSNGQAQTPPPDDSPRVMRAVHDYDPSTDSPNENCEEELSFSEGDLIKVFGSPGEDGFYQAELKGRKGLVPMNFVVVASSHSCVELQSSDDANLMDKRKSRLILSNDNEHISNLRHSD